MSDLVTDPLYWATRLKFAIEQEETHRAVFNVGIEKWNAIVERRRRRLFGTVCPSDAIIDIGCAWGWTRNCLPKTFKGRYVGIDICPEFIAMARAFYPQHEWLIADARLLPFKDGEFDVALLGSMKNMLQKQSDIWPEVEVEVCRAAKRYLNLEYRD